MALHADHSRSRQVHWKDAAAQAGIAPESIVSACVENPIPILIPCHRIDFTDCPDYDPDTYPGDEGARDRLFLRDLEALSTTTP
ncbi:MGMT family protein [Komagataeibacter kakiaceti]|uniref:MGMT family protein n=1 Tax=Komagataeibacter kakiaceti TaxID=943261 RepID=UPI001F578569|nr:MGMT family protein [Komagataeibacter kakiaceti]